VVGAISSESFVVTVIACSSWRPLCWFLLFYSLFSVVFSQSTFSDVRQPTFSKLKINKGQNPQILPVVAPNRKVLNAVIAQREGMLQVETGNVGCSCYHGL